MPELLAHGTFSAASWNEPAYMFVDFDARTPFARESNFGFRCMKTLDRSYCLAVRRTIVPSRGTSRLSGRCPTKYFAHTAACIRTIGLRCGLVSSRLMTRQ